MDDTTAVVLAAAVGGVSAIGGVVIAEPVRAWSARRAEERRAASEILHRSRMITNVFAMAAGLPVDDRPTRAGEGLPHLAPLEEARTVLLVVGRRRVIAAAQAMVNSLGASWDLIEEGATSEKIQEELVRCGELRGALIACVRPWWRRQPDLSFSFDYAAVSASPGPPRQGAPFG